MLKQKDKRDDDSKKSHPALVGQWCTQEELRTFQVRFCEKIFWAIEWLRNRLAKWSLRFVRVCFLSAVETVGCAVSFSCSEPESSRSSLAMPRTRLRVRRFSSSARRVTKSGRTQRTPLARCSTGSSGERRGQLRDSAILPRTRIPESPGMKPLSANTSR